MSDVLDENCPRSTAACGIGNLPDEIIAEILAYLSGGELKSATLASQRFANIVASSSTMMRKFFMVITTKRKWDFVTLMSLRRKHQALVFFDFVVAENSLDPTLLSGLENVGGNLKSIEFNDCCMHADDLREILKLTRNIRHLKIIHSKINGGSGEPLLLPQLLSLKIKMTEINFETFSNVDSLTKILLEVGETSNVDVGAFRDILKKQSRLKSLALINLRLSNLFDSRLSCSFQLETLKLTQCHFKHKENFEIFLDQQRSIRDAEISFSHMNLGNDRVRYFESIVESLLKKDALKTLSLSIENYNFCSFNFLETNRVEKLILTLQGTNFASAQYVKYFPSLKSLELDAKELTNENVEALNSSPSLVHLKVHNLASECFSRLKIKSLLKSLHIHETSISECDWLTFVESHPQITRLVINFSILAEFDVKLLDRITKKLPLLEHIELTDKYLGFENEIYEIIVGNCGRLRYIKLWNINIEKDFEEKDREFLRARNIRFHLYNDESLNKPMIPF